MHVCLLRRSSNRFQKSNISTSIPPDNSLPKINNMANQVCTSSSTSTKVPHPYIKSLHIYPISTQSTPKVTSLLEPASRNEAPSKAIYPSADKTCCKECGTNGTYFLRFICHLNKSILCKKHNNMEQLNQQLKIEEIQLINKTLGKE